MIISIFILVAYILFLFYILQRAILYNRLEYLLYFLVSFLPIYTIFLCITYQGTESVLITRIVQYSKEIIVLLFMSSWLYLQPKILDMKWKLNFLDYLFLIFAFMSLVYALLPIGPVPMLNKLFYLKNIFLMCIVYFFGRNSNFSFDKWKVVFRIIFITTLVSFIVVTLEKINYTHFHSLIGYSKYHIDFHNIEPSGNHGLTWTFEAQGGTKRFGSIFANPLEYAASLLLSFSAAIIFFLSVKHYPNKIKYLSIILISIACIVLAYSRASFVAFIAVLFFAAIALKQYKLILAGSAVVVLITLYVIYLAPDETRFYIEDTFLLQETSTLSHLLDYYTSAEAMVQNPLGLGLATSGNTGGVEDEYRVGGENQFLIFGVQMGYFGFLIYFMIMTFAIVYSLKAYYSAKNREEQIIPFVASTVKFGLILPLLTANAETYLFVSLVTWWMVGYNIKIYQKNKVTFSSQ
jgi:hypothetical protein